MTDTMNKLNAQSPITKDGCFYISGNNISKDTVNKRNTKSYLYIAGYFCPDSNISKDKFEEQYKAILESKKNKPIGKIKVEGLKSPKNLYVGEINNFFEDDMDYGLCFEGELYITLSERKIQSLSLEDFHGVDLPEIYPVTIQGIQLEFYPIRWLY
jgi:hypothetical protein